MNRDVKLINYLPHVLREYEEFKVITNAEDPEFKIIFDVSEKVRNNMFIKYCDLDGIKKYENLLGIRPSNKDTLEDRIFRVLSRWNDRVPYTWKVLIDKLDMLCGKGNYEIKLIHNDYTIDLETHLNTPTQMNELLYMLDVMIPCNLIVKATNKLLHEMQGISYVGATSVNCNSYIVSSYLKTNEILESNHFVASILVKSNSYILSSDINKFNELTGKGRTASTQITSTHYELY
ncbi:MAG: DUF2313 domain-containing protein [Clostridium argentinense]|nr:DUF2313 domain-containing protein [Clostridium argentinense]